MAPHLALELLLVTDMAATITVTQFVDRPTVTPAALASAISLEAVSTGEIHSATDVPLRVGVSAGAKAMSASEGAVQDVETGGWNPADDTATFLL